MNAHGIEVLYVDDHLLAVDKPAGLLAVPGRGADKQDCVVARVQVDWPDALVVHRLDMATSGLMLLARGIGMQRALSRIFAQRQVVKRYVAVVAGQLGATSGCIDLPLAADWPQRPLQRVDDTHGKAALTHWRVLHRDATEDTTRVELQPVTGRTHQLRVHLQAIGHPILGDALYAPEDAYMRAERLLLHACELELPHPGHGGLLALRSDVPF
jgi:tRNA pseudouridine32 synthase / 23S rRNA pseudouridine746 synthase